MIKLDVRTVLLVSAYSARLKNVSVSVKVKKSNLQNEEINAELLDHWGRALRTLKRDDSHVTNCPSPLGPSSIDVFDVCCVFFALVVRFLFSLESGTFLPIYRLYSFMCHSYKTFYAKLIETGSR